METLRTIFGTKLERQLTSDYVNDQGKEKVKEIISTLEYVISGKELISNYLGDYSDYTTGVNKFNHLETKQEWLINWFDMPGYNGFIAIFKTPDNVTIIQDGMGLGSETYRYAFK